MQRRLWLSGGSAVLLASALPARAHHGWSGFDQSRPIYLAGRAAAVRWRNPHAEVDLALDTPLALPADLAGRAVPAQSASVDGPDVLKRAVLPTRKDGRWRVELAPLTRMSAWNVPELTPGTALAVVGYTTTGEAGDAVLRAEYLFVGPAVYGLRSSPA